METALYYTLPRVLHVGTAIVLVGGTFFIWFVLQPAAAQALTEADHLKLRERIMRTWKTIVHAGIALLLGSGGVNYYRVLVEGSHKGDSLYHALLGTKILLAMAIFFIASALVGRSAGLESFRRNSRKWLAVNLVLALLVVGISGFLKVRGVPPVPADRGTTAQRVDSGTIALEGALHPL
ncbi:MAG: hypothetical protein ACKV0T_00430 [Planctomycetales bacterium]